MLNKYFERFLISFSPYFMLSLSVQILDCKTITEMCLCVVEIDICDAYL